MEKNWYIIYTKPGSERKIAASLGKRKIEYFLPICNRLKNNGFLSKSTREPLFTSYVFLFLNKSELTQIQEAVGAISIVYWKGKPVTVPLSDIQSIKDFINHHDLIRIIPIDVDPEEEGSSIAHPPLIINETFIVSKAQTPGLRIPSIGFILMAEGEGVMQKDSIFHGMAREKMF